jgi:hypothetical protein
MEFKSRNTVECGDTRGYPGYTNQFFNVDLSNKENLLFFIVFYAIKHDLEVFGSTVPYLISKLKNTDTNVPFPNDIDIYYCETDERHLIFFKSLLKYGCKIEGVSKFKKYILYEEICISIDMICKCGQCCTFVLSEYVETSLVLSKTYNLGQMEHDTFDKIEYMLYKRVKSKNDIFLFFKECHIKFSRNVWKYLCAENLKKHREITDCKTLLHNIHSECQGLKWGYDFFNLMYQKVIENIINNILTPMEHDLSNLDCIYSKLKTSYRKRAKLASGFKIPDTQFNKILLPKYSRKILCYILNSVGIGTKDIGNLISSYHSECYFDDIVDSEEYSGICSAKCCENSRSEFVIVTCCCQRIICAECYTHTINTMYKRREVKHMAAHQFLCKNCIDLCVPVYPYYIRERIVPVPESDYGFPNYDATRAMNEEEEEKEYQNQTRLSENYFNENSTPISYKTRTSKNKTKTFRKV